MIGIVVVTHGRLAEDFLSVMQHVVGEQSHVKAICIGANDDVEERRDDITRDRKSTRLNSSHT